MMLYATIWLGYMKDKSVESNAVEHENVGQTPVSAKDVQKSE